MACVEIIFDDQQSNSKSEDFVETREEDSNTVQEFTGESDDENTDSELWYTIKDKIAK